jgi:hypothetical protein
MRFRVLLPHLARSCQDLVASLCRGAWAAEPVRHAKAVGAAMPERSFLMPLNASATLEDRPSVRIQPTGGRVAGFVAQYEAGIGGRFIPVVRCDGSHRIGHRELLDGAGVTIVKEWLSGGEDLAHARNVGIADMVAHGTDDREAFIAREGLGTGRR